MGECPRSGDENALRVVVLRMISPPRALSAGYGFNGGAAVLGFRAPSLMAGRQNRSTGGPKSGCSRPSVALVVGGVFIGHQPDCHSQHNEYDKGCDEHGCGEHP